LSISSRVGLIGDIGGTDARFALVSQGGEVGQARVYSLRDYSSLGEAIERFLVDEAPADRPSSAVLAVASPVTGDQVVFTNHQTWTFSVAALRQHLRFERLQVMNDFTAIALSVPQLQKADVIQIGPGSPTKGAPIGVIGPGTGLGVGALLQSCGTPLPISGEGGHVTMAPVTAREAAVVEHLRKRFEHVSAERLLSGPGLVNLYQAICDLASVQAAPLKATEITLPETWTRHQNAREATNMFCAMLGTVAGNLALTLGARGGIYIGGGIIPKMLPFFAESPFRRRFESKGRLTNYVTSIPTYIITRPFPALVGAAWSLRREQEWSADIAARVAWRPS
jgi:glucokinase